MVRSAIVRVSSVPASLPATSGLGPLADAAVSAPTASLSGIGAMYGLVSGALLGGAAGYAVDSPRAMVWARNGALVGILIGGAFGYKIGEDLKQWLQRSS